MSENRQDRRKKARVKKKTEAEMDKNDPRIGWKNLFWNSDETPAMASRNILGDERRQS